MTGKKYNIKDNLVIKPTKVTTDSEGVIITHRETNESNDYNVNINGALDNYYEKTKTYTKDEVNGIIAKQEAKATDIAVYKGTFTNRNIVVEGDLDTELTPRVSLTYSSSTGVGILRVDFIILRSVSAGEIIATLPLDAPKAVNLLESQVWIGNAHTSLWVNKEQNSIKMLGTSDSNLFNKRIIINILGIFKKD